MHESTEEALAASLLIGAIVLGVAVPARAYYYSNVWGELNGRGFVVHYSTLRTHDPSIRPRMRLDKMTAFNFHLWMRTDQNAIVSNRAAFHSTGQTTYWSSTSGSTSIPKGQYKLSGQMMGELQGSFDPSKIRWQGDITW